MHNFVARQEETRFVEFTAARKVEFVSTQTSKKKASAPTQTTFMVAPHSLLLRLPVRLSLRRELYRAPRSPFAPSRLVHAAPATAGRASNSPRPPPSRPVEHVTTPTTTAKNMLQRSGKYPAQEAMVARQMQQQPQRSQHTQNRQTGKDPQRFVAKDNNVYRPVGFPTPMNSLSQNRDIRTAVKMAGSVPTKPLTPRSSNSQPVPAPRFGGICGSVSNSFKDEVHGMGWNRENHPSLEQDMEWLGDQSDLDIDPEELVVLPPPKPQPVQQARPTRPVQQLVSATKAAVQQSSQTASVISWSSSPSTHKEARDPQPPSPPPKMASSEASSTLSKRKRDYDAQPPARKRKALPFKTEAILDLTQSSDDEPVSRKTRTPAAKSKFSAHEASASVLKEKRRNLKQQSKKAPSALPAGETAADGQTSKGTDLSMEIKDVMSGKSDKRQTKVIALSKEQQHILELVKRGKSVFFTGPAGTGKSVLMKSIIDALLVVHKKDREKVAITASTGLAACNIGGITLHSFSGIGLGKEEAPELVKKIRRNAKAKMRWKNTKALIIDEISMVDGDLFDKLNHIGRALRGNGRPWGGLQLILTGDFFQLPPVPDEKGKTAKFAFDASTWNTSIDHTIGLTHVFRQRDADFAGMLNEMRLGKVTDNTVQVLKGLERTLPLDDGIEPTELFPTRYEVERANSARLKSLPGQTYTYSAEDKGDLKFRDRLLANVMAPKTIDLKVGAQVMLIKNLDPDCVNGTVGTVKRFETEHEWNMARAAEGGYGSDADTLPSHESGADMKKVVRKFENGGGGGGGGQGQKFPVVEFPIIGKGTRAIKIMLPEEWKVELPTGEIQAQRAQVALILAWALSIHKAQGQTLERVKVNLGRTFERGQAYVALSRATTKEGLQVLGFDKSKVMAHPRVCHFYDKLYSAEQAVHGGGQPKSKIQTMLGLSMVSGPAKKAKR